MTNDEYQAEHWADKLGYHINGCEECQPFEGEIIWTDDHMSLAEFLDQNDVPEELHELVAEQLSCSCGHELELSTEIVVDSSEVELDAIAGDRFGDWIVEDNPRLNEFVDFLERATGPGASHEVGIEILKQLRDLPTSEINGSWWRARSLPSIDCPPQVTQLGPPPGPSSKGGRFNNPGRRAFYLAVNKGSAIAEARKYQKPCEEIWLLQYNVTNLVGIADLTAPEVRSDAFRNTSLPSLIAGLLWCDGLIEQGGTHTHNREYLLAQFLAECAISVGIKGFKINSQLHHGTNLVLLNWDDRLVNSIGHPELGEAAK